jgi:tripartite-type tricarboxylate transporter receptor subunit TctC
MKLTSLINWPVWMPCVALLMMCSSPALAQLYPTKPVRIIVPTAPGGFTDVVARILSQKLTLALGQQVVIENKAGAGSTIGADLVAKAAPDGYTLLMTSTTHVLGPSVYPRLPYDTLKSFTPVARLVDSAYMLVVNPKLPVRNVAEYIALAKSQPDSIHYASSGNGSSQHLVGSMFANMVQINIRHVPYKGSSGATTDLLAGVVESSFAGVPNVLGLVQQGKLRALAVSTPKRIAQLPDIPTLQESGVTGFDATIWLALLAPAGTPKEVVNRLHVEISKALSTADTQRALFDAGVQLSLASPEETGAFMSKELDRWGKVIRDMGIKPD